MNHAGHQDHLWKFFQGYTESDMEFIRRLRAPHPVSGDSHMTDFFGMKVDTASEPTVASRLGTAIDQPPFPTDGWLAEGAEYAGLALALRHAQGQFVALELGAGFGPWMTLSAICARRLGLDPILIAGVEADPARFLSMRRHLEMNGLLPPHAGTSGSFEGITWDLRQAIVWNHDTGAFWPRGAAGDAGLRAAASDDRSGLDYRGYALQAAPMASVSLRGLLSDLPVVDFLHVDIQGSEYEVLRSAVEPLGQRVKFMMVACHSRLLEGQVMELMFRHGWLLERETPCNIAPAPNPPTLEALTFMDSSQVWRNLRFSAAGS